jgi:hypothetical protein
MIHPHKKWMKKAKEIRLKKKDPVILDGSSPYAEFLVSWFRQYNPTTHHYDKGPEAVIHGGPSSIDPDILMHANFGRSATKLDWKPSAQSSARPLNFYNEPKTSVPKLKNHLLSPGDDDEDEDDGAEMEGSGNLGTEMTHDRVMFQQNYKVKPHKEDIKNSF